MAAIGGRRTNRAAYHDPDALAAEATLENLARQLAKNHPGAAGSLRERLAETLTVTRLGVPSTLARTLRSTNAVESMIEICRDHSTNVKRWRDGQMALRWCAAGMVEASKQSVASTASCHALPDHAPDIPTPPMTCSSAGLCTLQRAVLVRPAVALPALFKSSRCE